MRCDTLIVDGRHALWRTSDAFKTLAAEVGEEMIGTGGMYGFLCLMIRIHQRYGGQVVVAWEGLTNFRKDLYPLYKDKSHLPPEQLLIIEDMRDQEKRLKSMLRAMGVEQYYGVNCEADDVIGRLSKERSANGEFVIIYSGDSDLRQLVTDNVYTSSPGFRGASDTVYDKHKVQERHKVVPGMIADLKALSGDTSDNIPGLKGIGDVTAAKLINRYGAVENVVTGAEEDVHHWPVAERFRKLVLENIGEIRLYKKLTKIRVKMPMKLIALKKSKETLVRHFGIYHFNSLLGASDMFELMTMDEK